MNSFISSHIGEFSRAAASSSVTTTQAGHAISLVSGIGNAVEMVINAGNKGRTIYFIGNGGSASICSHMAVDFWKTAGIKAVAFTDPSLLTCISNDYGYSQVFQKPLEMFISDNDILIAISSSGRSQNILNGVDAARSKGASVISMSGFDSDNPLLSKGDINFYVPSSHYGIVEVTHALFCHTILDTINRK
jgi:D-sedoheptulose 7-phosphate isomerase